METSSSMVEAYLKSIADHTEARPSFNIIVSDNTSSIRTTFSPPLAFPKGCNYEMAVCSLETYYSFPNIDASNNSFKVSLDAGSTWKPPIQIPIGCYEIKAINKEVKRLIVKAGGKKDDVTIAPNVNTLQCIITLKDNIIIDFNVHNSLRSVLGFNAQQLKGPGRYESENVVNIMKVNSIMVHCDVIGASRPIIYNFFPNVGPGEKIVTRPKNLIYLPITLSVISHMTCWLTDQDGNLLNLRGEEITITFHIKSC